MEKFITCRSNASAGIMPVEEVIPVRKGEVNIVSNEQAAFMALARNCQNSERMVITIKPPSIIKERYGLNCKTIWLTYFGYGNGIHPDKLEFDLMDRISRELRTNEPCILVHGVEYLSRVLSQKDVFNFIRGIKKVKEEATVILAVNYRVDEWSPLGTVTYRRKLRIPHPVVILREPQGEEVFRISRGENHGDIMVNSVYDAERLIFAGMETIRTLNRNVHIDCLDFLLKVVDEDRVFLFLKDVVDALASKNLKLYITPHPSILRSPIAALIEDTGFEVNPTSLVGRDAELRRFEKIMDEVLLGRGHTVFVSGEAGIGKTTLVNHVISQAVSRGFVIMKGRAYYNTSEPYLPIKDALRGNVENVTEILAPSPAPERNMEIRRASIFYELTRHITEMAKKSPILLFLDDVHWMDYSSLKLLHYMAENLRNARALIIATYRPEDASDELREIMHRMTRDRLLEEIRLRPLTLEETGEVVREICGRDMGNEEVEEVYRKAGGNPLFTIELVSHIPSEIRGVTPGEELPEIILSITNERLGKLSDDEREMVKVASLIGDHVEVSLLSKVTGKDEMEIIAMGEEVARAGIWEEDEDGEGFVFRHSIIRDGIASMVSKVKRKYLHRKIAEEMESLYGEEKYQDIAYQYKMGGDGERAYEFFLRAGNYSSRIYAFENSIKMYEEALKIKRSAEVLEKLGHTYSIYGEYDRGREYLWEALKLARENEMKKRIYGHIAKTFEAQGDFKKALKYIDAGLSVDDTESSETAKLVGLKGWIITKSGNHKEALKYLMREKEIAERVGDRDIRAIAYGHLGILHYRAGEYPEAIDYLKKALNMAREIRDKFLELATLNNLGIVYEEMGNISEAVKYYEEAARMAEKIGDRYTLSALLNNLSLAYQDMGELERAMEYLERAQEMSTLLGDKFGLALVLENKGAIYKDMGRFDEALESSMKALQIGKDIESEELVAEAEITLGDIYFDMGKLEEAKRHASRGLEVAKSINSKSLVRSAHRLLGKVYREEGEYDVAMNYLTLAMPPAERFVTVEMGMTLYEMGILKMKMGRHAEGEKDLRRAKEIFEKLGFRVLAGKAERIMEKRKVN